jgi:enoyl-CoA hydratase/carnithine racemase
MPKSHQIVLKKIFQTGILRLVMNNVESKNALSIKMMKSLMDDITFAAKDKSIKVIVIGANGNVFSAGHNLKEITEARSNEDDGDAYFIELLDMCSSLMKLIVNCPKPIIAEVNGIATAAGCQLVASCDLAIASNDSKFATPGVNIGLFCSTPMVALSRNVHKKNAMEMLLTGDMISSKKAKEIGLINDFVEVEQLTKTVMALADKIARKPSSTVATGKKAFYEQTEMNLSKAYEYTSVIMKNNLLRDDAKEGISAFIDKRSPDWQDD